MTGVACALLVLVGWLFPAQLRTCQVEQVLASSEWATVLRNRNAHDLAEHRAASNDRVGVVPARPVEASDEVRAATTEPDSSVPPPPRLIEWRQEVERWRPLVGRYFAAADIDHALAVVRCESLGDPNARNPQSGTSGLFQHRPGYWTSRSSAAGWAGADIFDPEANTAVAAWLVYHGGGWSHWSGRPWGVDGCQEYAEAQGVG